MKIEVERATFDRYLKHKNQLKVEGQIANNDDMINYLLNRAGAE